MSAYTSPKTSYTYDCIIGMSMPTEQIFRETCLKEGGHYITLRRNQKILLDEDLELVKGKNVLVLGTYLSKDAMLILTLLADSVRLYIKCDKDRQVYDNCKKLLYSSEPFNKEFLETHPWVSAVFNSVKRDADKRDVDMYRGLLVLASVADDSDFVKYAFQNEDDEGLFLEKCRKAGVAYNKSQHYAATQTIKNNSRVVKCGPDGKYNVLLVLAPSEDVTGFAKFAASKALTAGLHGAVTVRLHLTEWRFSFYTETPSLIEELEFVRKAPYNGGGSDSMKGCGAQHSCFCYNNQAETLEEMFSPSC